MDEKNVGKSYSNMYFATTSLHVLNIIVLYPAKCYVLVGLNILSILLYITLGIAARRVKNLIPVFLSCATEISVFTIVSQTVIGEECGYLFLLMCTIPIAFYLVYAGESKNLRKSIILCVLVIALFYIASGLRFTGLYRMYTISRATENLLFIINTSAAFLMLIGFLFMFNTRVNVEKDYLERENIELENSANYDALTKLLNRRSFDNYIFKSFKETNTLGRDFTILMCDIDDFKKVNDTYGHDCGDLVLVEVAKSLKKSLRGGDVVFRWGGEEILILVKSGSETAKKIAERCRGAVSLINVPWKGENVKVTITIGGCSYYVGATKDTMIEKADINLYHGKQNGKNQVVF